MVQSKKALEFIAQSGIPTSGGALYDSMFKRSVYEAVEIAEAEMKERAIRAFEAVCQPDNLKKCTEALGSEGIMPCCYCSKKAYFIGRLNQIEELHMAIVHIAQSTEMSEGTIPFINEMAERAYENK